MCYLIEGQISDKKLRAVAVVLIASVPLHAPFLFQSLECDFSYGNLEYVVFVVCKDVSY